MKEETKEEIKNYVMDFVRRLTRREKYDINEIRRGYPFHALFFPDEALVSFKLQRRLVTKMGQEFYPRIALIIARERYSEAYTDYVVSGEADEGMINKINRILDELRENRRKPNAEEEWREIVASRTRRSIPVKVIADLYVGDFRPGPLFLEIKSPLPNLDVCERSKKKILYFKAMNYGRKVEAYLAFPYNPFVYRERYSHSITSRIMDLEREVLIGEEMWDKIGGKGTYNELLDLLEEIEGDVRRIIREKFFR